MARSGPELHLLEPIQALDMVTQASDVDAPGVVFGQPLIAVWVDDSPATRQWVEVARRLACVTVGVADQPLSDPPDLDILVCAQASPPRPWIGWKGRLDQIDALLQPIARNPGAAVALVQLLRLGKNMAPHDAIVAESFVYSTLQSGPEFGRWLAARPAPKPDRSHPRTEAISVTRREDEVTVCLSRPEVHNAFNIAMRDQLTEALAVVNLDPTIRQVELRAAGPDFCSGGDLSEFGTGVDPLTNHLVRTTRSPGLALLDCQAGTQAHLHGACIGAGIELPAFCQRVYATPVARFRLPEVSMGLVPGAGGTASIPQRIGRQRSAWMAITGVAIDAPTALAWGLIEEIVEPECP